MEIPESLKKYRCEKKECVWWGYPQYGGICCGLNRSKGQCDYYVVKVIKQTKLIDF